MTDDGQTVITVDGQTIVTDDGQTRMQKVKALKIANKLQKV